MGYGREVVDGVVRDTYRLWNPRTHMIINAVYRDVIFDETRFPWKEAQDGKQVLRDADLQLPLPAETGRRGDLTERKQSGGTNLKTARLSRRWTICILRWDPLVTLGNVVVEGDIDKNSD